MSITLASAPVAAPTTVNAADVLKADHPVHAHFVRWVGDKERTLRQARKFLAAHPYYKGK